MRRYRDGVLARALGGIGRSMVVAGCFILGFVAYQLWGTGLQTSQSQKELTSELTADVVTSNRDATIGDLAELAARLGTQEPETAPPLAAPPEGDPIGIIEIPRIGLQRVFVEGVAKRDLKKGPGHYPTTPLPGQPGNAAIAGHRTTYGAPFNRIDELQVGDEINVTTVQGRFTYRVRAEPGGSGRSWFTVRPDGVQVLDATKGNQLTLTACHPKYSARQRIIVVADLSTPAAAPAPPGTPSRPLPSPRPARRATVDAASLGGQRSELFVAVAFAAGALMAGLAAWFLAGRWRRWAAWALASPVVLVLVWCSYVHLDRYLPAL